MRRLARRGWRGRSSGPPWKGSTKNPVGIREIAEIDDKKCSLCLQHAKQMNLTRFALVMKMYRWGKQMSLLGKIFVANHSIQLDAQES